MPVLDSDAFTPSLTTSVTSKPFEVSASHALRFCTERPHVEVVVRLQIALEDHHSRLIIGQSDFDVAIKTTRTAECWVDNRGIVACTDDHDTVPTDTAIEFLQKPIDHAAHVVRIMAFVTTVPVDETVDLIDEQHGWSLLAGFGKSGAHGLEHIALMAF